MVSERLCEFSPTTAGSEERVTNIGRGSAIYDDAEQ
jgi:hypothetical protein